jgi:FAD/FMN-containing dehydrogenase
MISRRAFLGGGTAALGLSALGLQTASSAAAGGRTPPWSQLAASLHGTLVLPSSSDYATAKELDLLQFDYINPQGIAYCASASDAATCLAFAQDNTLPIAVRSGGHSLGGYSTTQGLIIDVSGLNTISVGSDSVTLGPGAENVDILTTLAAQGLAVVGGACPTVASGGFIQGGGLGFLTPPLGMACDNVTSAQVVLADGQLVTASAQEYSDLFWALRGGGGGNFGIVTSYTVTPSAVSNVLLSDIIFDWDQAQDMLDGYGHWLVDAPQTIGGAAVITLADAGSGTPAPMIIMVSLGTSDEFSSETSRLLSLTGAPASQTTSTVPYQDLMLGLYGCSSLTVSQCHLDPAGQLPRAAFGAERSRFFSQPMSASGWAAALAAFDAHQPAGMTLQLQVIPAGGAVTNLSRTATAYVHRDSIFVAVFSASVATGTVTDSQEAAGYQWVTGGFNAINPYSNGESYQNFIDPQLLGWQYAYYGENYPELVSVKKKYDPAKVFSFAQSIA